MARGAYYNEIDPYCVEWLRNLISAGLIPAGDVDSRSIEEVQPDDIAGYVQCHFFAGLGGWAYAARLAGWPDDRPLWTGSCPCQPFSVAGKGKGADDPRHLWPHLHRIIRGGRPAVVMGEQVAGAAGYDWFDGVRADLAAEGYQARAVDIPAASVNAPHRRNRLYWVANRKRGGCEQAGISGGLGRVGRDRQDDTVPASQRSAGNGASLWLPDANDSGLEGRRDDAGEYVSERAARSRGVDYAGGLPDSDEPIASEGRQQRGGQLGGIGGDPQSAPGFWDRWVLIGPDREGKYRRIEPGITPLAHGISNRVGRLRAYGNAICAPLAAEVIRAWMETA